MSTLKTGNLVKFIYIPQGAELPQETIDNAIYFVEGEKKIYVNGVDYGFSAEEFTAITTAISTAISTHNTDASAHSTIFTALETAIGGKVDKVDLPTIPTISTDITTDGESDTKTASPKAVKTYVDSKVASTYKASGSLLPGGITSALLISSNLGNVYNITSQFETTNLFIEGAGKTYPQGTNIVVALHEGLYKFDVLSGFIDLSLYDTKDEVDGKLEDLELSDLKDVSSTAADDKQVLAWDDTQSEWYPKTLGKADVGLGSVENYEIATKNQAEAGSSNIKYMTPLRTREAIEHILSWEVLEGTPPSTTTTTPTIVGLSCLTNTYAHYTEIIANIKNNSSNPVTLYLSPSGDYLGTLAGSTTTEFVVRTQAEGTPGSTTVSVYAEEVGKNPSAVATKTELLAICAYTN